MGKRLKKGSATFARYYIATRSLKYKINDAFYRHYDILRNNVS